MKRKFLYRVVAMYLFLTMLPVLALASNDEFTIVSGSEWNDYQRSKYGFAGKYMDYMQGILVEYNGSGGAVMIPEGTITIDEKAFRNNESVTNVTIPSSVIEIDMYAFENCTGLTDIVIPDTVQTVQPFAFSGCTGLKSITIGRGVTHLHGTFEKCTGLTSVTIPDSVTFFGMDVFYGCTNLTSVTLPNSIDCICSGAFSRCTSLEYIVIPDSVTRIDQSFYGCINLNKIIIPSSVTQIAEDAFKQCDNLTIYGMPGSYAERYANEQGIPFVDQTTDTVSAIDRGFNDVRSSDYFSSPVLWAVENGITAGTSDTTFSPYENCTVAQILTFLWRANGSPEANSHNVFADVSLTDYYYEAALWAKEKDIVSESTLHGNAPCTRSMAVTYMWKAAGSPISTNTVSFVDTPSGADYAQAVAWAVENGITDGTSKTTFSPDSICTRGQIVTFLYRHLAK